VEQLLTATADLWNTIYNFFGSYRALDEKEMSTTVLLPLVDREVGPFNGYSTRFQIENKDPSQPAQVTMRFEGFDLDNGNAFVDSVNNYLRTDGQWSFAQRTGGELQLPAQTLVGDFTGAGERNRLRDDGELALYLVTLRRRTTCHIA